MAGWHVTANDIKNWTATNKRRAEEILPLLIKKLIMASCVPKEINFPSGDSVAIGGWDGILDTDSGNEFVPDGKSGWEIGTDYAVKGKADSDYDKRLKEPDPFEINDTTFVFVTSRLWTKRDIWVRSKQSEKKWKAVKGINAEALQNWLEKYPPVHRWFAELIGKRSADLWDAEQAWSEFANTTAVPLTTEFFLHERDEVSKTLISLILGAPNIYRIKSSSKNEAYGFILALLMTNDALSARCLIIKNQHSWDLMVDSNQSLILIAKGFQPNGIGSAVSKGHTVLLAVDDKDTQAASATLNRQPRTIRQIGIQKLGFNESVASELYNDTKGYLEPILRHQLMQPIDYAAPSWPSKVPPDVLFAIFFATEWSVNNEHDKKILSTLSGMVYSDLEKEIIQLSKVDDSPVRLVGNVWQIISKMDFWLFIAPLIANPYVDRLGEVVSEVLSDVDPSYDLPSEKRYMANIKGAIPRYSNRLKHCLADSMAILSVHGDEYAVQLGGDNPSSKVCYWVRKLFEKNSDTRFWYSLHDCMQLIAEAAPEEFLVAVENASAGENPPLLGLFEAEGDGVFGGCYHSNLLWALELISWNKQYLSRVSLCLARLAEIDPGGRYSNRPFNSLVDIYLGWINNTSATHEERIKILDKVLIPQYPDIAWRLMISLLINKTHTTSGIYKPDYREWSKDIERDTTTSAYYEYVRAVVDLLFRELEQNIDERLYDLVDNFDSYDKVQQQRIIKRMLSLNVCLMADGNRSQILNELRSTIAHHREFPEADWSWPTELLDQLEEVYCHFDYDDLVKANTFLFDDHWPKLIEPINRKEVDFEEREALVEAKRIDSIEAIYANIGLVGLENLLNESSYPGLVGSAAFKSSLSELLLPTAFDWLGSDDKRGIFADSYIFSLARNNETRTVNLFNKNIEWSAVKKARYLLCLPLSNDTFKLVEGLPSEGKSAYWSKLSYYFVSGKDVELISYIASNLLENKRPLAAVDALARGLHGSAGISQIDNNLVASILMRIATDPTDIKHVSMQGVRYDILKAIEYIQDAAELREEDIRQIEWAYLRIFRFEKLKPRYLLKSVSEDPNFFAQLVIWGFRRNDGREDSDEEMTKEQIQQRAGIAWELLRTLSIIPSSEGADIDSNRLNEWVAQARTILKNAGRGGIGDDRIGDYLSHCPVGSDGIWPHEAIRSVIESVRSKELEDAVSSGKRNLRGVTTKNPYAGGEQERALAQKYSDDAEAIQLISPRTAGVLRSIAKSYEWEASNEDRRVELRD